MTEFKVGDLVEHSDEYKSWYGNPDVQTRIMMCLEEIGNGRYRVIFLNGCSCLTIVVYRENQIKLYVK